MNKIDKLTAILSRLNSGEDMENVKKEALELVSNIDPLELSLAEQKLIESGLKPEDLRHLCEVHMEVLKDELEKLRSAVSSGHVLDTMIKEHDEILKLLSLLETVNNNIQKMDSYNSDCEEFKLIDNLSDNIIGAENHHQREEQILFAELERRQITGPTRIMRMEHDDLREKKHILKKLAENVEDMNFEEFRLKLDETAKYIIFHLRDHIFKENHILYPSAVTAIEEDSVWNTMKEACDKIGYCPFTPKD